MPGSRVFLVLALGCLGLDSGTTTGQVRVPVPETEVLAVGQITELRLAERSFILRRTLPGRDRPSGFPGDGAESGPIVLGGSSGVTGADDPINNPRPFPDRRSIDDSSRNLYQTVYTTVATRIHQTGSDLSFAALRVGDRVTVRGEAIGDSIRASDVARGERVPGVGIIED